MTVNKMKRVFEFQGEKLSDPDPSMSVTDVIEFYSSKYPEITVAKQKPVVTRGDELVYELEYSVGNKA